MTIVGQNKSVAVNYDNLIAIEIHGTYISAHPVTGGSVIPLGLYKDAERTLEVLGELERKIAFSQDAVYVMPEE